VKKRGSKGMVKTAWISFRIEKNKNVKTKPLVKAKQGRG
jgi:hypothetical protein